MTDTTTTTPTPLWDVPTPWITPTTNGMHILYKNWSNFLDNMPQKKFKPYIMTSWSWKDNTLQLVFNTLTSRGISITYIEMPVKKEEEPLIRAWIKRHISQFWNI